MLGIKNWEYRVVDKHKYIIDMFIDLGMTMTVEFSNL